MDYDKISDRLRSIAEKEVGLGATPDDIARAERQLGSRLPEGYRCFLREFGWGGVGHWELFGLGPDVPFHLDLVRTTLSERSDVTTPRMPAHLVAVMNDGSGSHYCLDVDRMTGGEAPVVHWDHAQDESQEPMTVADDFASWLWERLP